MTIPIRNLYYLFLYAWARFPGGSLVGAGIDDSPDLPNLFAKLLRDAVRRLFKRGLHRGYQAFTDEMVAPRGRLRLDRMIKESTHLRGSAVCDFDELTHDILLNRILKATLLILANCDDVDPNLRHDLRRLIRRLYDVADIRLTGAHFRQIVMSQNNREYGFLVRICEFVFWAQMPSEDGGGSHFKQVLKDEIRMSALFEEFLRNFYRLNRTEYRVRAEAPEWDVSDATPQDLEHLPRMVTDITLRHSNHVVIIDAKFYAQPFAKSPYGRRVHSEHLYQLITYLKHAQLRHEQGAVAGMLIYPDVGESLRLRYRLLGIPVLVATVDLGKDWRSIEHELHELLNDCARAADPVDQVQALAT